jgi:hypothetical protein
VEAHCGSAGHREYEVTLGAMKEYVAWTTMAKDFKVFVQNCLHCFAAIPGIRFPTRWIHGYMQPIPTRFCTSTSFTLWLSIDDKNQYSLLLKDDLSGCIWLVPCPTANDAATVDASMRWCAVFGVVLFEYRTEAATSRARWYEEYRRIYNPSIIVLRQIACGRTT